MVDVVVVDVVVDVVGGTVVGDGLGAPQNVVSPPVAVDAVSNCDENSNSCISPKNTSVITNNGGLQVPCAVSSPQNDAGNSLPEEAKDNVTRRAYFCNSSENSADGFATTAIIKRSLTSLSAKRADVEVDANESCLAGLDAISTSFDVERRRPKRAASGVHSIVGSGVSLTPFPGPAGCTAVDNVGRGVGDLVPGSAGRLTSNEVIHAPTVISGKAVIGEPVGVTEGGEVPEKLMWITGAISTESKTNIAENKLKIKKNDDCTSAGPDGRRRTSEGTRNGSARRQGVEDLCVATSPNHFTFIFDEDSDRGSLCSNDRADCDCDAGVARYGGRLGECMDLDRSVGGSDNNCRNCPCSESIASSGISDGVFETDYGRTPCDHCKSKLF